MINSAFWRGKHVFLTGHTGFKGGWMSLWLQRMGTHVTGYALTPPTNPSLFEVAKVSKGMTSLIGDIRDLPALQKAMSLCSPEIVFHFAAQPLVRQSYVAPLETYAVNIMGTLNLLESIRNTPSVKAVVVVTTDKCYENNEADSYSYAETDPLGGYDPYSSSKACAEIVASAYFRSFLSEQNIALATVRAGNVIGGGDWALDRLVPDILRAIEKKQSIEIRNPNATRPWQHVLEPLTGYLMLAEKMLDSGREFSGAWNFGPEQEDNRPVEWIVKKMLDGQPTSISWHQGCHENPHEAKYLSLDINKAKSLLKWKPKLTLESALEKVNTWHQSWLANQDMRQICIGQIEEYMKQGYE